MAVQLSMRRQLEKAGYRVEITGTGDRALSAFRSHREQGDRVDLLIADLGVPGMDGRTLLQSVQKLDPTARVLLTSGDVPGEEEGYEFLAKPFEAAHLLRRIESILRAKDEV